MSEVCTKNSLFGWSMVNEEKEFTGPFNPVYSSKSGINFTYLMVITTHSKKKEEDL